METTPWQTVCETAPYLAQAEKIFTEEERDMITLLVAKDPEVGVLVKGTGGVRKVRVAREGAGKSGGARVVYFFHSDIMPAYLLAVFAKNDKANLSMAERNGLRKMVREMVKKFKEGRTNGS